MPALHLRSPSAGDFFEGLAGAALAREDGVAPLAAAVPAGDPVLLNASALHHAAAALTAAPHTNELRRRPETVLNIDLLQSGLGGESCGPLPPAPRPRRAGDRVRGLNAD